MCSIVSVCVCVRERETERVRVCESENECVWDRERVMIKKLTEKTHFLLFNPKW